MSPLVISNLSSMTYNLFENYPRWGGRERSGRTAGAVVPPERSYRRSGRTAGAVVPPERSYRRIIRTAGSFVLPDHSHLKAAIGSARVARRDGMYAASNPAPHKTSVTVTNVSPSVGCTPYSRPDISRPSTRAPNRP